MDTRQFNPLFTLRYDTAAGEVIKPNLLSSDIHLFDGPRINRLGDIGRAWGIAVLDKEGDDVTHLFPCFT